MQLVGSEKYQPDKLEALEKYVDEQVTSNTYNLDANLALLRFYQFQPQATKINTLAKVLLKAIMRLPEPDFRICVHLVPERLQNDDTISKIIQLANALETTRFAEFWSLAASSKDLISTVPGFYECVRSFVLQVLGITFQRIPRKLLSETLKLDAAALDQLIAEKSATGGWSVQGDLVVLPKNDLNQPVVKRTQEVVKFDQVSPVLRAVTVGF